MEVINVKEAKEYVLANYPNDPLLKHIVLNLLEQLPKVEVEQGWWIPVTERLPEMFYDYSFEECGDIYRSKVVLASDGAKVCEAEWVQSSDGNIPTEVVCIAADAVMYPTHWMPLPEPPKEGL